MPRRILVWLPLFVIVLFRILTPKSLPPDGLFVRITGRITSEPVIFGESRRIFVEGLKVYVPIYPEVYYGDTIIIEGRVDNRELKKATLIEIRKSSDPFARLRKAILSFYSKILPQPHLALVAGVVLGSKENIPSDFWEKLKATGTAHVVVASGMNITLVAKFLISILVLFLPRRKAVPLALAGIWGYSAISGFDAPIVRAAIMGSLTFGAQAIGRLAQAWRILLLSAVGMLVVKPEWISDIGFILSFVATATLMAFEGRVRKFLKFVPGILREGLSTSLAAQIGVAPILFVTFGQFSLLSPVVNAFILWTVPGIMIIAGLGGVLGLIIEPFGRLVLLLSFPLTYWFVSVIDWFS